MLFELAAATGISIGTARAIVDAIRAGSSVKRAISIAAVGGFVGLAIMAIASTLVWYITNYKKEAAIAW